MATNLAQKQYWIFEEEFGMLVVPCPECQPKGTGYASKGTYLTQSYQVTT